MENTKSKIFFFIVFFAFFSFSLAITFFRSSFFFFFSSFELKERLNRLGFFMKKVHGLVVKFGKTTFFIKKDRLLSTQNVEIVLPKVFFFYSLALLFFIN